MPTEFEAKILNVDPAAMTDLIVSRGGRQVAAPTLQRRYVYDIVPGDQSRWIRLRASGHATTIAVKQVAHDGIDGTHEVETAVDSFGAAHELLGMLGFGAKGYQENRRTSFLLDGAQLEIDEWPLVPPYLEIEASSPEQVVHIAERLGYAPEALTSENTTKVYARYGIDLAGHSQLRFVDPTAAQ
ncbi:class IV adenylate cyclase [Rhodococcus ruber]|uniref:class IV adenylate cyclase n=1 Tax=Rhodococcus ruber TaxID=1830 RepID=UPI000C7A5230|nr:CYTH domain-containing protein [Rhodococcus ruber]AUM20238.1 adenylate cyclase [Rhodococcus ruber]